MVEFEWQKIGAETSGLEGKERGGCQGIGLSLGNLPHFLMGIVGDERGEDSEFGITGVRWRGGGLTRRQ